MAFHKIAYYRVNKTLAIMFKQQSQVNNHPSKITALQDTRWTRTHILALTSQIILLIITVIIITNMLIKIGNKRLQDDWAGQRYSELQTAASLASDKVNFLKFRTQAFANGELVNQYIYTPNQVQQEKLKKRWDLMSNNIPELLGISLYSPQGQLRYASNDSFKTIELPKAILGEGSVYSNNDTFSSDIAFTPINGRLEPFIYQVARIERENNTIDGYVITFNSITRLLDSIKPAFYNPDSPLLLLSASGILFSASNQNKLIANMPESLGASLKQSDPALWQTMSQNNYGQYHTESSTFVFLKVELTGQNEHKQEYYLLSYILHNDIVARFEAWKSVMIISNVIIGLLGIGLIVFRFRYLVEKKARYNSIHLTHSLFNSELSYAVTSDNGRILSINPSAAQIINHDPNTLADRSLQRILQLDDETFNAIQATLYEQQYWQDSIHLHGDERQQVSLYIHREALSANEHYWIVVFDDISKLTTSRKESFLNKLLSKNSDPTVIANTSGDVINANTNYQQLVASKADAQNIFEVFGNDFQQNWHNILAHITLQGEWHGVITPFENSLFDQDLHLVIDGHLSIEGDVEYLVISVMPQGYTKNLRHQTLIANKSNMVMRINELEQHFNNTNESIKQSSSLLLMDINPEGVFSNIGDITQLEKRQAEIEVQLLHDLPVSYQLAQWQLGRLVIFLPQTDSTQAHLFAIKIIKNLTKHDLEEGINIGIAGYIDNQSLHEYLANAEVALKRAKQSGDQNICQAFTRAAI